MIDPQQCITIPILAQEHASGAAYSEVAVPFAESQVFSLSQLTAHATSSSKLTNSINALCKITAVWPNGSIKWITLAYQESQNTDYNLTVNKLNSSAQQKQLPPAEKIYHETKISGKDYCLTLDLNAQLLKLVNNQAQTILSFSNQDITLTDSNQQPLKAQFKQAYLSPVDNLNSNDNKAYIIEIIGYFLTTPIEFKCQIEWLAPFDLFKLDLQVHNPNRAEHQGGKWDLGDSGSYYFNALEVNFNFPTSPNKQSITITNVTDNTSVCGQQVECQQYASGGENWQSPVHVNQHNQLELDKNGFELLYQKDSSGKPQYSSGLRIQPAVQLPNNVSMRLDNFWQNFPKSVIVDSQAVVWGLFPARKYQYELQGGERKTHNIFISLENNQHNLTNKHLVSRSTVDWQWIKQANLYPFMQKEMPAESPSLQPIIDLGLDEEVGFKAKREQLDEYGWRNIGELYADHETAGYTGNDIFVSHYNNQYDPIYGFIRQFLTTGNHQWFELANDLAKHVKDIDIYHTQLDKNEYNGGLFWHTDHYLQAFTSSHRSYSKHQSSDAYQDHAGGGGPGGQHCYTTGLYLHYCMTGQQSSKDAVLTLTNWITHVYEGTGTILELLLAFKNRHLAGYKNHFTGQYPLDRGVANYINALLDSYELTNNKDFLAQVEQIIANTMHPDEDVSSRDLSNVEETWFYTVLLQAVCRYLLVKQNQNELDQHFYYSRDCLLNFADWMLKHEYPYLEKPEILEYPNDTWTAQDLRKAHVLAAAHYFSADKKPEYMHKAEFYQRYVADKLNHSDTNTYTRILVLLMQNQGALEYFKTCHASISFLEKQKWPAAPFQQTSNYAGLLKVLTKRLFKLSPRAEIDWLKKRLA